MTKRSLAPFAFAALALWAALPAALSAQTPAPAPAPPVVPAPAPGVAVPALTAPAPMPPREPLPAPPGIRPFVVPQELVGRELGLEEAVNIALENAPLIVARIGDYVASQQRINQALAPLLPQLGASGSYGRARTVGVIIGNAGQQDFGQARLTASQLLFDFGRTWAAKDVAKSNAEALREVLEAQKLDISQLVKTQYFTLLLSKRLVEVNIAALDRAQVNLRSAQGFFQVGTQPKSFVTRAEVDVANARVNVIRAQNAVGLSRVALNAAMGVAVNAPTEVKDLLSYQDFPTDRNLLVSEALQNRPEYRQVKAQADAADALVRQTFRDFFPSLSGTGNYGLVGITGSSGQTSRTTSGFTDVNNAWEVGLRLELVHLRWRRPRRPLQGGQGRGSRLPRPGSATPSYRSGRASSRPTSTSARPSSGSGPLRRRWSRRPGELPALPGSLRRGRRQHHRAHRRPARPDPGPVRRGTGPLRLPHRHRAASNGPWAAARNTPRAPGASDHHHETSPALDRRDRGRRGSHLRRLSLHPGHRSAPRLPHRRGVTRVRSPPRSRPPARSTRSSRCWSAPRSPGRSRSSSRTSTRRSRRIRSSPASIRRPTRRRSTRRRRRWRRRTPRC